MLHHNAIRKAYPNAVNIDDTLGAFDINGTKIEIDDTLVQQAAQELESERLWSELRSERNKRLTETDYLALSDRTLTSEMSAYRQALRDLTDNTSDPANPVWPTKPS